MNHIATPDLTVNGRKYSWPKVPAVAICLDGCEPAYLDEAVAAGLMPALQKVYEKGTAHLAHCVMPSFTNPNNISIATGQPPSVHGICGNYLYEPSTGEEVMMNDPRFLRAPSIFKAFYDAGAKIALVTAKDKLRPLLGHGIRFDEWRAICFSSEKSDQTTMATNGIDNAGAWMGLPVPPVYSAELSEFVFAAGLKLLKEFKPDILYLSTTDYVQHKHAPGAPDANAFYKMFDKYIAELDALGAVIVITADHGMKPKHSAQGEPNVVYVQDVLDTWLGKDAARVILPITDPYLVHHGALGSFATAYLPDGSDHADIIAKLQKIPGLEVVIDKATAVERFELPGDRIGDVVLVSSENMTIGTSESRHDLSGLKEPLRSHVGLSEQVVPFIINRKIDALPEAPVLRNFDAYFYAAMAAARG